MVLYLHCKIRRLRILLNTAAAAAVTGYSPQTVDIKNTVSNMGLYLHCKYQAGQAACGFCLIPPQRHHPQIMHDKRLTLNSDRLK